MYRKLFTVLILALALGLPATQSAACPEHKTRCGTNLCC